MMFMNGGVGMGTHTLDHNNYVTASYEDQKFQDYNHMMFMSPQNSMHTLTEPTHAVRTEADPNATQQSYTNHVA